jgi:hypothetical protein
MIVNLINSLFELMVFLALLAVIAIVGFVLWTILYVVFGLFEGKGGKILAPQNKSTQGVKKPPYIPHPEPIPNILYHGTKTFEAALSILIEGWFVGPSKKIWMTSNLGTARGYGRYIVECHIAPYTGLTKMHGQVFTADVPHAIKDTLYRIHGVTPKKILNSQTGGQLYPQTEDSRKRGW